MMTFLFIDLRLNVCKFFITFKKYVPRFSLNSLTFPLNKKKERFFGQINNTQPKFHDP